MRTGLSPSALLASTHGQRLANITMQSCACLHGRKFQFHVLIPLEGRKSSPEATISSKNGASKFSPWRWATLKAWLSGIARQGGRTVSTAENQNTPFWAATETLTSPLSHFCISLAPRAYWTFWATYNINLLGTCQLFWQGGVGVIYFNRFYFQVMVPLTKHITRKKILLHTMRLTWGK